MPPFPKKPTTDRPEGDRPARPAGPPRGDRPAGPPRGDRPAGAPRGDRPERGPRPEGRQGDDRAPRAEAGAEGATGAEGEDAANLRRNEDGSITIGESGIESVKPAILRKVGPGVKPDARYQSLLVAKFINCLMHDGKKSTAEQLFYGALEQIAEKLKIDPLKVFDTALQNAKPMVEVRSKRVGGANYQVPVQVKAKRQQTLAIRWILEAVRTRKGRPTAEKLSQELIDCYNKTGATITKRDNTIKMAEANKAFSHFA